MAGSESVPEEVLIDSLSHLLWACLVFVASVILWSGVYFAKARRNFEDAEKVAEDIQKNSLALERYHVLTSGSLLVSVPASLSSLLDREWNHDQQAVFEYTESAKDFIDYILRKSGRTGPTIPWSLDGLKKIIKLNWPGTKRQIRELYRHVETAKSTVDERLRRPVGGLYMCNNLISEVSQTQVPARLPNDSMIQPLEYANFMTFQPSVASYKKQLNQFKPLQDLLIKSSIFILQGGAGTGKTELCHSFAWHHEHSYWGVFWFDAKGKDEIQLGDLIAQMVEIRRVQEEQTSITESPSNHEKPWLLIIDNANDFSSLKDPLPTTITGHILITTNGVDNSLPSHIHCEKMESLCCAKELLMSGMNLCSPWNDAEQNSASRILDGLENHALPLTLSLIGATIYSTKWTAMEYLKKFRDVRENILQSDGRSFFLSISISEQNTIFAFEVFIGEIKKGHRLWAQDTPELLAKLAELQNESRCNLVTFDALRREFELLHKRVTIWNRFLSRWQTAHGSEPAASSEPTASSELTASSEPKVVSGESAYFDLWMDMTISELRGICLFGNQKPDSGRNFSIPLKALRDCINPKKSIEEIC